MLRLPLILAMTYTSLGAVVIDRIAVIAGKRVIKSSDIDRDLRITEFLNKEPVAITPERKRKAAERLIDQQIIRNDIASGGYERAGDADASQMLKQIVQTRYGGLETRFRQALLNYGVTQEDLRMQLLWELTVLRFIDERFRPAVLVSDEEVRAYYNTHVAALKREYPGSNGFEALESKIRSTLEGEQINQQFEMWLAEARKNERIEYREGAFQ